MPVSIMDDLKSVILHSPLMTSLRADAISGALASSSLSCFLILSFHPLSCNSVLIDEEGFTYLFLYHASGGGEMYRNKRYSSG